MMLVSGGFSANGTYDRKFVLLYKNKVALKQAPGLGLSIVLPTESDLLKEGLEKTLLDLQWVNEVSHHHDSPFVCGESAFEVRLPPTWIWVSLREIALLTQDVIAFQMMGKAFQIIQWDKNHQFCGRCGKNTEKNRLERARVCKNCQISFFPRISPSGIVVVKRDDLILLARSPHFPPGVYSAIAGFVEAGETVEQAVEREVLEEVGIRIHRLQYQFSQPWPFPDSLMLGYTAEYLSGDIKVDGIEIQDAKWFGRDSLPELPMKLSIARSLIFQILDGKKGDL